MQRIFAKPGSEIVVDDPRECMIVHGGDARYELAKMFAKVIAKKNYLSELDNNAYWIAKKSVGLADALIAALKEEK